MQRYTLKIGQQAKRLRIIRDNERINEELNKYNQKKYEKYLLISREQEIQQEKKKKLDAEEAVRKAEDVERNERLKELEKKEAQATRFWKEFVIANEGKLVNLDLSKISEDTIPISVAKEEIQHAYERGMEDGQLQAMSTYKIEIEKYQDWIRRIDNLSNELSKEHTLAIESFENNLVDLSVMIAESILDEHIAQDKSIVLKQVRKAIASVYFEKIFKIHVNPDAVRILTEVKSTLLQDEIEANKIEIYPNPGVPVGGCLLETSGGMLDARIKNQLRKVYKELQLEDERVFNTKEVEEELNSFYDKVDEEINSYRFDESTDSSEISDYDDETLLEEMPEEYKELYGDDIFGEDELDLEGNKIEDIPEVEKEEQSSEIDYGKLYEDEVKKQEDDEFSFDDELGEDDLDENKSNDEFGLSDFNFDEDVNND